MVRRSSQGRLGKSSQAGWGDTGRNDAGALMEQEGVVSKGQEWPEVGNGCHPTLGGKSQRILHGGMMSSDVSKRSLCRAAGWHSQLNI